VLDEAGVEVQVALGEPPLRVLGVAVLLEQVLVSLLLNARDALAVLSPGAPRRLWIAAEPVSDHQVKLTVADTGGGIDAALLPRLFEPFATTKGPDRGRGLGLATAHGLVRSMDGTLCGANGVQGAIFTLTMPSTNEDMCGLSVVHSTPGP
jgi:two-component system C4-dicarboxylate transport sensor histidine kinase DctB